MDQDAPAFPGPLNAWLDHVVVMLDPAAYRDLLASEYLRERFARVKVKEAASTFAGRYTSAAVAGENTLIEFFDVDRPPIPGTTCGLVFSFEVPGSHAEVLRRLQARGATPVTADLVRRAVEGEEEKVPWYHLVRPDLGPGSPFLLMLGEVTPEYFARIAGERGPAGELPRRGYLAGALGVPHTPEHRMRDVVEATVRLRATRAWQVAATLQALGYDLETRADGYRLRGPGMVIHLKADDEAVEGVLSLRLAVGRDEGGPPWLRFGESSVLTFEDGGTALWSFAPPLPAAGPAPAAQDASAAEPAGTAA